MRQVKLKTVHNQKALYELTDEKNYWENALIKNTIDSFLQYLDLYPYGKYSSNAKNQIEILKDEIVLPRWEKAKKINTYNAYENFNNDYPGSSYSSLALQKMEEIEENDWERACLQNSLASYKKYLKSYPYGEYANEAEDIIIDLEINKIFAGKHSKLPPAHQTSYAYSSTSEIVIENATQYSMTLYYSGPDKIKIEIQPYNKIKRTFSNGFYKVGARVSNASVYPFVGERSLSGGGYSEYFYIVRTRY